MDKSIGRILKKKNGGLDFTSLLKFMEESGIKFKNRKLRKVYGIATYQGVYLDMDKLVDHFNDRMIWYIILHEIGHFKRIEKIGKNKVIELLSHEDFDEFCNHIIGEEIIADRYACFVYFIFNKENFPREATQQLETPLRKLEYRGVISGLFGIIKNDEENYKKLFDSYVVDELQ
jgi:hypothetical protein